MRQESLNGKVRWLVGGSVNLTAILSAQGKIKLVNDLKVEPLAPFTKEEVEQYVKRMFEIKGVLFDNTVLPRIIELLGCPIPLFLQMLTQEIYRLWKRNPDITVTDEIVSEVFHKTLLGEMARDKLLHYRSRIALYYPEGEREAALYLLNKISISQGGMPLNTLFMLYRKIEDTKTTHRTGEGLNQAFQNLMMHLQSDFYIESTENGNFDFASPLLKTWWKKYYGFENSKE
jgi:hypothetical protein